MNWGATRAVQSRQLAVFLCPSCCRLEANLFNYDSEGGGWTDYLVILYGTNPFRPGGTATPTRESERYNTPNDHADRPRRSRVVAMMNDFETAVDEQWSSKERERERPCKSPFAAPMDASHVRVDGRLTATHDSAIFGMGHIDEFGVELSADRTARCRRPRARVGTNKSFPRC